MLPETPNNTVDVFCLCAAWCGNCRDYRPLFESLQARFQGVARFAWIDIEDESAMMGEIEIENFPTLLLIKGDAPLFLGPLPPQAPVLAQIVSSALADRLAAIDDEAVRALALRVRQRKV